MAVLDVQDTESNAGVSDVTGMELNNFQYLSNVSGSPRSRQEQGNIFVYAIIGILTVAVRLIPEIVDYQLYRFSYPV
jgi:hypothetical protein